MDFPLAEFSARLLAHLATYDPASLPEVTRMATGRALLDAVGVMLAASGLSEETTPYRRLAEASGSGRARMIGSDRRTDPTMAALANGALAHALDFGDTFDAGPAHPNAGLVPALLALADERPDIPGDRFVSAMALGSDLCCRLSLAAASAIEQRGWYPPPVLGLVGATAACAHFLSLDAAATGDAIGLAMCQATFPGEIRVDSRSPLRAVREGFVAQAAVLAARQAERGARAFDNPLEGRGGFLALYAGEQVSTDKLLDGLGERFLGDLVSFKPWPSCRGTHAYIEAALKLAIDPERIVAVTAGIGPVQLMLFEPRAAKVAPATAIDAKFSVPFTLASAFLDGAVTLDSFDETARRRPDLLDLAARIVAVPMEGWTRAQAASGTITVTLDDGSTRTETIMQAAGHPQQPLSTEALVTKFEACAARALRRPSPDSVRTAAGRLLNAASLPSAADLLGDLV